MPATNASTLAQVLALAQRLPPADKVWLIAHLAPDLAAALPADAAGDAWDELLRFGDEVAALPPLTEDSADTPSAIGGSTAAKLQLYQLLDELFSERTKPYGSVRFRTALPTSTLPLPVGAPLS